MPLPESGSRVDRVPLGLTGAAGILRKVQVGEPGDLVPSSLSTATRDGQPAVK